MADNLLAQSIPFNLKVMTEDSRLEAEPLDFSLIEARALDAGLEEAGRAGACIGISARENIPVFVEFSHEDVSSPLPLSLERYRPRVSIQARWLNDGGPCPTNTEAGIQASRPFSDGSAYFPIDNRATLIENLEGRANRLTAFVYLVGTYQPGETPTGILGTLPQPYEGRVTISIEYL